MSDLTKRLRYDRKTRYASREMIERQGDRFKAADEIERLHKALTEANTKLSALVIFPPNPNWGLAFPDARPADIACLDEAYRAIREALGLPLPFQERTDADA